MSLRNSSLTLKILCIPFAIRGYFHGNEVAHHAAPTRVEFLFQVLLGIAALFRVVTPHNTVAFYSV